MLATKINNFIEGKFGYRIIKAKKFIDIAKSKFNYPINVIEIGTFEAKTAEKLLKELNILDIYCIDPFVPCGEFDKERISKAKIISRKKLSIYPNVRILELKSDDAWQFLPDSELIYIDGNHDYSQVKKDIKNGWNNLKKGGILAGDDFWSKEQGVIKAVIEFALERKLNLNVSHIWWWIIK